MLQPNLVAGLFSRNFLSKYQLHLASIPEHIKYPIAIKQNVNIRYSAVVVILLPFFLNTANVTILYE